MSCVDGIMVWSRVKIWFSYGDKMRLDRLYSVYVDYAAQLYNEEYQMLYLLSATITIDTVGLS
jgi:hypothetical protein